LFIRANGNYDRRERKARLLGGIIEKERYTLALATGTLRDGDIDHKWWGKKDVRQ
jgi:hypothetical protein